MSFVNRVGGEYQRLDALTGEGADMRTYYRILLPAAAASIAFLVTGCFSKTDREIDTAPPPPPVVQVTPPVVTTVPGTQTTTITPAPGTQSSTTTWQNGAVVQRNTVTEPQPGVVEKQTTTTWDNAGTSPSESITTTTTTNP
jgi:hypothetical protein